MIVTEAFSIRTCLCDYEMSFGMTLGCLGAVRSRLLCCAINEVLTWNCYEEEESNWLIKP